MLSTLVFIRKQEQSFITKENQDELFYANADLTLKMPQKKLMNTVNHRAH